MTLQEWEEVKIEADQRMKANNGHSYITILKTRCQFCGKSPKVKTRCGGWFQTYLSELTSLLIEKKAISA